MRFFLFLMLSLFVSVGANAADPLRSYSAGHFAGQIDGENKGLVAPVDGGLQGVAVTPPVRPRSVGSLPGGSSSGLGGTTGARPAGLDALPCAGLSGRELIDCRAEEAKKKQDSLSEMGEEDMLRLQQAMDRKSKTQSTLSNIMKKSEDTQQGITQNLK